MSVLPPACIKHIDCPWVSTKTKFYTYEVDSWMNVWCLSHYQLARVSLDCLLRVQSCTLTWSWQKNRPRFPPALCLPSLLVGQHSLGWNYQCVLTIYSASLVDDPSRWLPGTLYSEGSKVNHMVRTRVNVFLRMRSWTWVKVKIQAFYWCS